MSNLTFTYWTPRGGSDAMARIYVNGLSAKVHLARSTRGVTIRSDDPSVDAKSVRDRLVAELRERGVEPARADGLNWEDLVSLCAPRRAAAPAAPLRHARDNPRLPERLVDHGMDLLKIPVETPFKIVVDHREPELICAELRRHPMARVEVASLEIGDFLIEANGRTVVVERKAITDFQGSVQEGYIFDQAQRIALAGEDVIGVVLIEGETLGDAGITMLPQSVTGAITCLGLIQGLAILQTLDARHSAWTLVKLAHHCTGLGYELPLHKSKPAQLVDARTYVLQSLPGVSAELARRLIDHFGSVQAVMAAPATELMKVRGLGQKTAARIREVVQG